MVYFNRHHRSGHLLHGRSGATYLNQESSLIAEGAETLIKLGEGTRTFDSFLKADNTLTRINTAVAILQMTEPATLRAE